MRAMYDWLFDLNIFKSKKKEKLSALDFSCLQTDIHSHLIPAIDDGSPDLETSIKIIKEMKGLGYKKLITTPHIMSDFYRNSPEIIRVGLEKLRHELKNQSIDIELNAAAEYYVDYDFEQKIGKEELLTFGDNYILIEFSFLEPPRKMFETIYKLQMHEYKVVLAHPERYPFFEKDEYKELKEKNVFFQLNSLSLIGYYSKKVQEKSSYLIDSGYINFLGTDCHNLKHSNLYESCQTERLWHELVASKSLLNNTL